MNIVGIIAEYNPFHNGHKYQIDKARESGATHIVAVMSANFAQRGEPCILNKFYRARAAVLSGVDLVLELPTPYSLSSAEGFAFGAIDILKRINVIDCLSFGAETDDINILTEIVDVLDSQKFKEEITPILKLGYSFPKARQIVLEKFFGREIEKTISGPNNILAIEYIRWIKKLNLDVKVLPIKRFGPGHDGERAKEGIASAFYLRNILKEEMNIDSWKNFVPKEAFEVYKEAFEMRRLPVLELFGERAVIYKLRSLGLEEIKKIQDVSEGLEHRIFKVISQSASLKEVYEGIKTKRYTMSRIKRIVYNLFLDNKRDFFEKKSPYVRILSSNKKGLEVIKKIKEMSDIHIESDIKRILSLNDISKSLVEIETRATDMHGLFYKEVLEKNLDYKNKFTVY